MLVVKHGTLPASRKKGKSRLVPGEAQKINLKRFLTLVVRTRHSIRIADWVML